MQEWLYYNFAAGSVQTQENFVADFIRVKLTFVTKNQKIAFWATLSGLRGNIGTPSLARWKAHGRLYIHHNWTFFASFYGWDVLCEIGQSQRFQKRVGHFQCRFQREGASPTNQCWCQKARVIAVLCGIKISGVHHLVLSQYTHLMDRWTDRQNCNSNTMHCITRRTVKMVG